MGLVSAFALFFLLHVFAFKRNARAQLIDKIGYPVYRLGFSLCAFACVYLGVVSWNDFPVYYFYEPPLILKQVHIAVMPIAFYLWVAARGPSHVKRFTQHPMLLGIILWSCGHLLANGDSRSMLLFVSMLLFALVSIPIINQRPANDQTPTLIPSWKFDLFAVSLGMTLYLTIAYYHGNLMGVPIIQYVTQ